MQLVLCSIYSLNSTFVSSILSRILSSVSSSMILNNLARFALRSSPLDQTTPHTHRV
ncbi:hypothetical protein DEO72_LG3g2253 [Vigna unguiculata]|nr:hypothetical protein DEO72_LG3g2253 [Vigna unguiculata]